jgi:hypothetical protein
MLALSPPLLRVPRLTRSFALSARPIAAAADPALELERHPAQQPGVLGSVWRGVKSIFGS